MSAVTISKLQFRWKAMQPLVLDIDSLVVKDGESVFIKGVSGSGKSTLLNIIGGVLEPLDGQVSVLGQDMTELSPSARDQLRGDQMGFVFQMFNLMPYLTVIENVLLPVRVSKLKLEKLTEKGLVPEEEAKRLLSLLRLDTNQILDKKVTELSVGQQQRVAAARAMMARPALVIADEPTSALDQDSRESFVKVLFEECKKNHSTLVFVSHDGTLAPLFDRTIDLVSLNKAYRQVELI